MKRQSGRKNGNILVWDPQVGARVALAFIASVLVVLLAMLGLFSGPGGAVVFAQAEPTPTEEPTGPAVQFLNPNPSLGEAAELGEDDLPDVSDKDDGVDEAYHIVAAARAVPANAVLEAYYTPETAAGLELTEITVGQLEAVEGSTDTFEFFWEIPDNVPEGTGTLAVRMFTQTPAGFEEIANDEQEVEMRHKEEAPPPSGDAQPASETVELTFPTQNGPLGFFKPRGGQWRTVVDGSVSTVRDTTADQFGPLLVEIGYTKAAPGTEPEFVVCGDEGGPLGFFFGGDFQTQCTLQGKDTPSMVTGLSAVVLEDQNPETVTTFFTEESSDAHRVAPFVQDPSLMKLSLRPLDTSDTDGTFRETTDTKCIAYVVKVNDQFDRPVQGANVDIHATGPSDQLQFGDEDVTGFFIGSSSSGYKAPEEGNHQGEAGENCDRGDDEDPEDRPDARPVEGQQGDHNRPGTSDEKHRESTLGSGLSGGSGTGFGGYNFHLFSPTTGTTQITAWVDDAPIASEAEVRGFDTDTLDPGEPSVSGFAQWLPTDFGVSFDPVGDTAAVGSCNRYTVKVRAGTTAVTNINVDVHATGPTNDLDFCDPGDGSPRRAPDAEGDGSDEHQSEDAGESFHQTNSPQDPQPQHTEGETDDNGNFVIGITSPVSGDTTLNAWVDGEAGFDNDQQESGEPNARATKSWASSIEDAEVSFVNPSAYGGAGTNVSNKQDADNRYHIVTRVDAFAPPGVELFISSDGTTFTKIGDATQVGATDTFEFFWDVNVPDGSYTLRAQLTGTSRLEDQRITVNNQPTPNDPRDPGPLETLEMTRPLNSEGAPFSRRETIVSGVVSDGTEGVDLFYTKVGAKDTPQSGDWISCGFVEPNDNRRFEGTCRLQGSDQASQVTGVAAITFDCLEPDCNPAPAGTTPREPGSRESGDAHRVFGFEGNPLVSIEPAEAAGKPGTCQRFVLSVDDETGQAIADQNVDVHLTGPTDTARFCDPSTGATARRAPELGGHAASGSEQDEATHAQDGADTQHTEGETTSRGEFVFGITSDVVGDSVLFGWVDLNDNDEVEGDERSDTAVMHWTTGRGGGGGNNRCTMTGDGGDNVMRGTPGDDVICGGGGNDTLIGRGGDDVIKAGKGRDIIRGGGGNDVLRGGDGADRIRAGSGRDKLFGNGGNDFLNGQAGRDTCRGGGGRDTTRSC